MMPKLSCLPVSLYPEFAAGRMTIAGWGAMAKGIGLDAVDLSVAIVRRLDADALKTAAAELQSQKMPVDTVAAYTDFTHPDAAVRKKEFALFKADIKAAGLLGAAYVRVTAGQAHPQTAREQGMRWAGALLRKAADFAARHGIGLLFENHSRPGVWDYCDFAGPPDVYFELVERLGDTGIDLLFDSANALVYRQEPAAMLEKIFARVRRIHLNDIKRAGFLEPTLIGAGVVNFAELFAYLKANNYRGMLSIEEASFTGRAGFERAAAHVRKMWAAA